SESIEEGSERQTENATEQTSTEQSLTSHAKEQDQVPRHMIEMGKRKQPYDFARDTYPKTPMKKKRVSKKATGSKRDLSGIMAQLAGEEQSSKGSHESNEQARQSGARPRRQVLDISESKPEKNEKEAEEDCVHRTSSKEPSIMMIEAQNDQNYRRITPASEVSKFWMTQLMMLV